MSRVLKIYCILVILTIVMLLTTSMISVSAENGTRTRESGTLTVPVWNVGDKWGYKIPQYYYSSDYYGVGFEVVGTEKLNGIDCYKVQIWWDSMYGIENSTDFDFVQSGLSASYKYVGYAYFTKENLAIVKFSMDLAMKMKFDGSEFSVYFDTRAQTEQYDDSSYISDMLDNMLDWKYDISYDFSISYTYDPPFVMYDYPLLVGKKWNASSTVTVDWEYSTKIWMNDAMKKDMEELSSENPEMQFDEEKGSNSTEFGLNGAFEVIGEDTIYTDSGEHEVFIIQYNIYSYGSNQRAIPSDENDVPELDYGEIEVPGGDATLELVGGTSGTGKSYLDSSSGHPQKMENGYSYYSDTYSSVDPTTIENSYNNLEKSSKHDESDDGFKVDDNTATLLFITGLTVAMVISMVVVLLMFSRRSKYKPTNYGEHYQTQPQDRYQIQYPYQNQYQMQSPHAYPVEGSETETSNPHANTYDNTRVDSNYYR